MKFCRSVGESRTQVAGGNSGEDSGPRTRSRPGGAQGGLMGSARTTLFFFKIIFSLLGLMPFHSDFSIGLPLSINTCAGIFIGNVVSPRDQIGEHLQLNYMKCSSP